MSETHPNYRVVLMLILAVALLATSQIALSGNILADDSSPLAPQQDSTLYLPMISQAPRFEIAFPTEGSVVNVGTLVVAFIPLEFLEAGFDHAEFQFSPDGIVFNPIQGPVPERVDCRISPYGMQATYPAAITSCAPAWRLHSGDALIPDCACLCQRTASSHRPRASRAFRALNGNAVFGPSTILPGLAVTKTLVIFDASESFDNDGQIVDYRWGFGDGTTLQGATVERIFTVPYSTTLSLTVTDDLGGEAVDHNILALYENPEGVVEIRLDPEDTCGCTKMEIRNTGKVAGPDSFDFRP